MTQYHYEKERTGKNYHYFRKIYTGSLLNDLFLFRFILNHQGRMIPEMRKLLRHFFVDEEFSYRYIKLRDLLDWSLCLMWINVWPKMIVMCTLTPAFACSINITFLPLACSYLKTHSEDIF